MPSSAYPTTSTSSVNTAGAYMAPAIGMTQSYRDDLPTQLVSAGADWKMATAKENRDNALAKLQFDAKVKDVARNYAGKNMATVANAGARNMALNPATMLLAANRLAQAQNKENADALAVQIGTAQSGSDNTQNMLWKLIQLNQIYGGQQAKDTANNSIGSIGVAY
jgi:hypothetical protein